MSRCTDVSADTENKTNLPRYVRFVSAVDPSSEEIDGEIRKSVQIEYCHAADIDQVGTGDDFAYCILTEEPNIQPIPIAVPCEIDEEMLEGTAVYAVGHGECIANDGSSAGYKRWATTDLDSDLSSGLNSFASFEDPWTTSPPDWACDLPAVDESGGEGTGDPDAIKPTAGDSGGGLFVQLSDGTWRVIGVAVTSIPSYASVWKHIGFMLADKNIDEDDIIPCHDYNEMTGAVTWEGGAACTASPASPDTPSGRWHRGDHSCHTTDTESRTNVCS